MKIECDFSELIEFAERLADEYELETTLMTITQNIARVLHSYLLSYTPVDTGNLRKMWSAGGNLQFTVVPVAGGFQVTLINTAQNERGEMYGEWVNDGHRTPSGGWVMGRFFIEKSFVVTEVNLEQIIYKELRKWWKWCVNG